MYTFYYPYYPEYKSGYDYAAYAYENYYKNYNYNFATYAKVCHFAFEFLQVPYQAKCVYFENGKNSEYMQYSPEGQLPMMSFDSYKYYDSMAILDYLFNKYPNEKLMPTSYPNRYKVYEAMSYMNTYVYPAYTQYFTARKYYPAQADYAKVEETTRKYLYSYYDKMEKYFASNKFYAGDFFSIADVMFAVMAEWAPYAGFKYTFGPNTQKYLDSIYSMPAYKAISESEYKAASQYYKAA